MTRRNGFFVGMIALALFVLVAPRAARAQLGEWTQGISGQFWSVTVDPSDPWRLYAVTAGGLFTSADGGANWGQMTLPFHPSVVAVSPSRLGALYAFGSGGVPSTRLFRTGDNGIGWSATAFRSDDTDDPRSVALDPRKSSTVYAGTYRGLSRSTDGGASWENLKLREAEARQIYDILFPPRDPSTVYVLDADYSYYPQFTVDKSTDGGATWSTIARDLSAVAIDPFDSSILYAASANCDAFYRSADAGGTWTSMRPPSRRCVSKVVADPVRPGHLYAGLWGGGVMRSRDGGNTWEHAANGILGNVSHLAIDPAGLFLHAATSGGVFELKLAEPRISPCESGPERLCLLGGRFEVSVKYGDSAGRAVPQGDRFGAFRRPGESPAEAEIFVKMADRRAFPNRAFWFFHSSVTDLDYTITVTDTATGRVRFYRNEPANPGCGAADTGAFLERSAAPSSNEIRAGSNLAPGEGDTLSLVGGRYQVTLSMVNPFTGSDDAGLAMPQTDRVGYFSFPSVTGDAAFPEVFVSLVELRPYEPTFSHTGLTNLQYTLTLTDRDTGVITTYQNDRADVYNLCGGSRTWIDDL